MRRAWRGAGFALWGCVSVRAGDVPVDPGVDDPSCDGRLLASAEDLSATASLVSLGYAAAFGVPDGVAVDALTSVVRSDAEWSSLVATLETDAGLTPNFERDAVFVHGWVDGGCEPAFTYTSHAWDAGGIVRVRGLQAGVDGGCDAYFPVVDVVVLPDVAGRDLGWCLFEAPHDSGL